MKHLQLTAAAILLAASPATSDDPPSQEPLPQSKPTFTQVTSNIWKLKWDGVAGRTYFIVTSIDLVNWDYEPAMFFGDDEWDVPLGCTEPNYFVRLHYTDDPSATNLEQAENADFDHDGVSNINEITILATNPFLFATDGGTLGDGAQDWDGDGVSNADEVALGLDPGVNNTAPAAGAATIGYNYDDGQRLTGMTAPLAAETFSPDREGNLE